MDQQYKDECLERLDHLETMLEQAHKEFIENCDEYQSYLNKDEFNLRQIIDKYKVIERYENKIEIIKELIKRLREIVYPQISSTN